MGFEFAWYSFYASYMIIPAFFGLVVTIYQIISGIDTIWTSVYAVIVSIWATIFTERWKRKSSEIACKWGVFAYDEDA